MRSLGTARANGCRRWAGREASVLGLCDWERGRGSRAGQGGVCAARKCTRMPPLSVSSGGAGPGAPARPPTHPPVAPAWSFRPRALPPGWGRLLLPLTEEARPNAPPGLPMTGRGVRPAGAEPAGREAAGVPEGGGPVGAAGAPRPSAGSPGGVAGRAGAGPGLGGGGPGGGGGSRGWGLWALGGCDAVSPTRLASG